MSFQPQIPLSGIAGWRFLQRTQDAQQQAFEKSPALAREIAFFEENIGKVTSAADLVADRRLLKVALGAFGLEQDLDKKAYIRKILDEGTTDPKALAMRLSDPAYRKFSAAFGFGDAGSRVDEPGFAARITDAYKTRSFEVAVGESNNNMRLALNFQREIAEIAKAPEGSGWFLVLGSTPLRQVFEKAFNLPREFGQIDVDRQREVMREKANQMFGTSELSALKDPENVKKIIDRYLARSQIEEGVSLTSSGAAALTLLQSANGGGSQGLFNLLSAQR